MFRTIAIGSVIAAYAWGAAAAGYQAVPEKFQQASQPSRSERRSFFPEPGTYASRTMVMMMPAEEGRLAERMVAAVRRDPTWFQAYTAQHPSGTLPYHPNLGISRAEYDRYLSLMSQQRLGEAERGQLRVTRTPEGGLQLSSSGHAAYLNGIVIFPDRNYVETRHGRLSQVHQIDQADAHSPTGAWRGIQWSNTDESKDLRVQLSLGRRADGERVIYYSADPSADEVLFLIYR